MENENPESFKRAEGQSEAKIGQEMTTLKGEGRGRVRDSVKDDTVDVRRRHQHHPDLISKH